ncbi:MAG: hypothetical protein COB12_03820 [Flavobacterium sp.]|nr:MAG: hypothetical protein COB12_03820 [Flavobacterium sp.]
MEPIILLIGKNLDTLEILKNELEKFNRTLFIANSEESIALNLKNKKVDLIIVGAGLPDEIKNKMVALIQEIAATIKLHIMEKTPGMTPVSMISYTNEKAVMWRLMNARSTK